MAEETTNGSPPEDRKQDEQTETLERTFEEGEEEAAVYVPPSKGGLSRGNTAEENVA